MENWTIVSLDGSAYGLAAEEIKVEGATVVLIRSGAPFAVINLRSIRRVIQTRYNPKPRRVGDPHNGFVER